MWINMCMVTMGLCEILYICNFFQILSMINLVTDSYIFISPSLNSMHTEKYSVFCITKHFSKKGKKSECHTWGCWGGKGGSWVAPLSACWLCYWPLCSSSEPSPALWSCAAPAECTHTGIMNFIQNLFILSPNLKPTHHRKHSAFTFSKHITYYDL